MINPIITQLQRQVWAMEPRAMTTLFAKLFEIDTDSFANLATIEISRTKPAMQVIDGAAIINIHGILMKNPPGWLAWFGIESTDYNHIRAQLAEAISNDKVQSIFLHVDSPGGTVAGASETVEAIANTNKVKPVSAYIEDLGASGAYYLASQAGQISANPNAVVGSIGVFTVYGDYSKMAETEGITIHVIRSGEHKGMGVVGAPITEEQIAAVQELVNGMAANFIEAVSTGRKISKDNVEKMATGRVWLANEAKNLGLIDSIINGLENKQINNPNSKGKNMAEEQATQIRVDEKTIAEKAKSESRSEMAEFQKAFSEDPQFAIEQFTAGVTLETAKANYAEVLKKKNAALEQEKTELEKKSRAKGTGVEPIAGDSEAGDQASGFMEAAKQLAKEEKITMTEAMKRTKKGNPELYDEYINSTQQQKVAQ